MYYFYGKVNQGHVVCLLYGGGPYLESRFHCTCQNLIYRSFPGKCSLPGKHPGACFGYMNGEHPLPSKCPG